MGQNYTVSIKYDYILMQTKFSPDPIPQPYLPPPPQKKFNII